MRNGGRALSLLGDGDFPLLVCCQHYDSVALRLSGSHRAGSAGSALFIFVIRKASRTLKVHFGRFIPSVAADDVLLRRMHRAINSEVLVRT